LFLLLKSTLTNIVHHCSQHKSHHDKAARKSIHTTKGKKETTDTITKRKEIG
jgi:hypothetical protein